VPALDIVFRKGQTRRYTSILTRADGVQIEMEGGSYNRIGGGEVPHDIAHLIVEDELRLERGVWGVLAAGGLFRGAVVHAGRQKPHAARHAKEVLGASVEQLNQAEVLVRAVCDLSLDGAADLRRLRAATGARWWSPTASEAALRRAFARLGAAGAAWAALPRGDTLRFAWPA
jgi:hypothetical protein